MDLNAPPCKWILFRQWAITVLACRSVHNIGPFDLEGDSYLGHRIRAAPVVLATQAIWFFQGAIAAGEHPSNIDTKGEGDIYSILQLIAWMVDETPGNSEQYSEYFDIKWMSGTLEKKLQQRGCDPWPPISHAMQTIQSVKACQTRLWDVVQSDPRQEFALPALLHLVQGLKMDPKGQHQECTSQLCNVSDDNSTQREQLHKCAAALACTLVVFDMQLVNANYQQSGDEFVHRAWSIDDNSKDRALSAGTYMAISHVWSDGTGVGMRARGKVNKCLWDFFTSLAKEQECEGIWWDTICLPTERLAKRKALNSMHMIYHQAKFVLVHDFALTSTVWKDDRSSCIALVLSDWFARGWTALELWAGRIVKILFQNSDGTPVLKELYADILAPAMEAGPHLGHRQASNLIRHTRITNPRPDAHPEKFAISRLLHILVSRATSFPRDKIIIAGLMAGVKDLDPLASTAQITKQILVEQGTIETALLFHDKVPMARTGPWSWCPASLLDLKAVQYDDVRHESTVYPDGTIMGELSPILVTEKMAKVLSSTTRHITGRLRVAEALQDWQNCLLLHHTGGTVGTSGSRQFMLVVAKGLAICMKAGGEVTLLVALDCDFVSTIISNHDLVLVPAKRITVRIGCDEPGSSTGELANLLGQIDCQTQPDWDGTALEPGKSWYDHFRVNQKSREAFLKKDCYVRWKDWREIG